MKTVWQILKLELEEFIYPTRCLGCDRRGVWFCNLCRQLSELQYIKNDCALCHKLTRLPGQLCPSCQVKTNLTGLSFYAKFSPPMRQAIHYIKYQNCWAALDYFTLLALTKWQFPMKSFTTIPIPLSHPRLKSRGYNQAQIIAKCLSKKTNLSLSQCLVRTRHTKSQVGLTKVERQTNLLNCFKVLGVAPEQVILIDDVYTTGSTLKEAAQTLKATGTKQIWGLVLAKD